MNELSTLVTKVRRLAHTGDKHPKNREAELQMFRDELKGHIKGHFPNDEELKQLYDKGGEIELVSGDGQSINYQA